MASEHFRDSLRRAAQSETRSNRKIALVGTMVGLAGLAGLLVATTLIPATALVASTANRVSNDVIDLPLTLEDLPSAQTSRLLASNGDLIAYFYSENRQDVPLAEISPNMQDALLSIEDARFYEHGGLDPRGFTRAMLSNLGGGDVQGASTLTQQFVKITLQENALKKGDKEAAAHYRRLFDIADTHYENGPAEGGRHVRR